MAQTLEPVNKKSIFEAASLSKPIFAYFVLKMVEDKSLLKNQRVIDPRMVKAIQEIKKFNGNPKIIDLASDSFLSHKQFNRRFKELSGFNPKMYARIIRLESAIKNYPICPNLTGMAHNAGRF